MSPAVPAATPVEDPAGATAGINRFRDLAKYIVTIFAAVGALLAAGTQLSSLGKLSWEHDGERLTAAVIALAVALLCIVAVVRGALGVLKPIEMSFDDVARDRNLREEIEKGPGPPTEQRTLADLRTRVESPLLDDDEHARAEQEVAEVIERAAFIKPRDAFDAAWYWMLGAGLVGAAAIAVFAWAANPPAKKKPPAAAAAAPAVVDPAPVSVRFSLSDSGRQKLAPFIGKVCVKRPVRALALGGRKGAPIVVVLPGRGCRSAQFTLTATLGVPIADRAAPTK